jgi:hypothetical protein
MRGGTGGVGVDGTTGSSFVAPALVCPTTRPLKTPNQSGKRCARGGDSGASTAPAGPESCQSLPQVHELDQEVLEAAVGTGGAADAVVVAEVELIAPAGQADRFAAAAEAACAEEAEVVRAALVRTSAAIAAAYPAGTVAAAALLRTSSI